MRSYPLLIIFCVHMPYTVDQAIIDLGFVSLDQESLSLPFYSPPEGNCEFWQTRLHPMVHLLVRASTLDFSSTQVLPVFTGNEHQNLCSCIKIVLWHFVGESGDLILCNVLLMRKCRS
jgi:hypothetical protein